MDTSPFKLENLAVEVGRGAISGPEGRVHVEPRVMDVLVFLAKRSSEVVTREELIEAVWEGYPGADQSLTNAASKLRQALEQVGGDRELLETIPKRGYRLVGAVQFSESESGRSNRRRWIAVGAIAAATLVLASILATLYMPSANPQSRPRLAVLPLENLGPVEEDHLAAGLTEEITTRLASLPDIGVISRTSAIQYSGGDKDLPTIASELGVDYILEGSIRWQDETESDPGRIRIATQLIRASDDTHLWANIYDRPLQDIFEVQAEIALAVAGELGNRLAGEHGASALPVAVTDNMAAYKSYLLGLDNAYPTKQGPEEIRLAYSAFHHAVELDPQFSEAWAELSLVLLSWEWDRSNIGEPEMTAEQALERAMVLAPDDPTTLTAAGWVYLGGEEGPKAITPSAVDKAIDAFRRTLLVRPDEVSALRGLGQALRRRGETDAGIEFLEAALVVGPRDSNALRQARGAHHAQGHFQRALEINQRLIETEPYYWHHYFIEVLLRLSHTGSIEEARKVLDEAPPNLLPPMVAAHVNWVAGDFEAIRDQVEADLERVPFNQLDLNFSAYASAAYRELGDDEMADRLAQHFGEVMLNWMKNAPDDIFAVEMAAVAEALLGRKETALEYARQVDEMEVTIDEPRPSSQLARIAAMVGEKDLALHELEQLAAQGQLFRYALKFAPAFYELRDDPRFQALLDKAPVNRPWRQKSERPIREMLAAIKADVAAPG